MYNPYISQYPQNNNMPTYWQPSPYNNMPQVQQPQALTGRVVNSLEEITANDVPMSGAAYFPKSDNKEIYLKAWNANGTINTLIYKLDQNANNIFADPGKNDLLELTNKINELQNNINQLREDLAAGTGKNKKVKEGVLNE